jgi:YidC/Oxa1 family membrane protein insertase
MLTPLATNIFQPLFDVFESVMVFFHDTIGLGWGTSIIALTVIVRALLLPLTLKQFRSMQSLAAHQPELKRLQAKYKGDRDRLNQEMMKFYRENKINPLASCLPMIAQLPVFISLFYMLRTDLRRDICPQINPPGVPNPKPCGETPDSAFLFIPDLTNQAHGGVLIALLLLYVGSQLASTALSTVSADRNQRLLMLALPVFFVSFVWRFPAGLLLYWITTNLWTIVQQMIVRRRLGPLRPPTSGDDDDEASGANGKGGGGLGALLGLPSSREPAAAGAPAPKARPTGPPPAPPR